MHTVDKFKYFLRYIISFLLIIDYANDLLLFFVKRKVIIISSFYNVKYNDIQ